MILTNRSRTLACITAFAITLHSVAARGDARADARRHYDNAIRLRDAGNVADAIEELRLAYEISRNPLVLLSLGRAFITIGKPIEAVDALSRFLKEAGTSLSATERAKVARELQEQEARIGTINLRVTPATAAVRIDGTALRDAAQSSKIRVVAGRHALVASLDGYNPATLEFEVSGGQEKTAELVLQALPLPRGTVFVNCPVPEVLVTANGTRVGNAPLSSPLMLRVGSYKIGFARAGYSDDSHQVNVTMESPVTVNCSLQMLAPLPKDVKARLRVVGVDSDSQTRVDGELVPRDLELPSGGHHVEVSRPGQTRWVREVKLKAGITTDLNPEFAPSGEAQQPAPVRSSAQRSWAYAFGVSGLVLGAGALGVKIWNDGQRKDQKALEEEHAQFAADVNGKVAQHIQTGWTDEQLATEQAMVSRSTNLNDKIKLANGIDIGLAVAAGALFSTGTILWLSSIGSSSTGNVALVPRRDGMNLSWWGAF